MIKRLNNILSNLSFALVCLLGFLLLFEDKIQTYEWVKIFGRMHTMVLHLPIGLFFVAFLFYVLQTQFKTQEYHVILETLFNLCLFTSIISAVFGLFLSIEPESYDSSKINLHKYSGSFFALGMLIFTYTYRKHKFSYNLLNLSLLTALIFFTGHEGGTITHGENYLFPNKENKEGDNKEFASHATFYSAVIYPILESKCVSCHKVGKQKGGLLMTDTTSIKKGGKNGPIIIAGDAVNSRMISYILKPIDDELHMAPKGKPQLTEEEINILKIWVSSGASFSKQINKLTQGDPLFAIAEKLKKSIVQIKNYTFDKADDEVVRGLNNPWRTVKALNDNSPALSVKYILKDGFRSSSLNDLTKIKEQIVHLNLSGMPLNNEDLKVISDFVSLEKLILNETNISNLKSLKSLKNLESLSLSNTPFTKDGLTDLNKFPKLKTINLVNTGIKEEDIKSISNKNLSINLNDKEKEIIKLTPPSLKDDLPVFDKEIGIELNHPIKGVKIHYELGEKKADSTSQVYTKPIKIDTASKISLMASMDGWYASKEVSFYMIPKGKKVDKITLNSKPESKYRMIDAYVLNDNIRANMGNTLDPGWIGFRSEPFNTTFEFTQPRTIKALTISYSVATYASIFPPVSIEVFGGNELNNLKKLQGIKLPIPKSAADPMPPLKSIKLNGDAYKYYKVICTPLSVLPKWHDGKGQKGWFFIDEVFFYD